jgi:hypothetical protein
MLKQERLLNAIEAGLRICRNARPTDDFGKKLQVLEVATLTRQLEMTEDAGGGQAELERVVAFLETNEAVRDYQRWRELANVTD